MKPTWKKYLLYASLIIVGGGVIFILVETIRAKNTGFETKTLWDWMELLVIPVVLAVGAFYLNRSERAVERENEKDRQQEAALQSYLDRMSELLLEKKLRTTKSKEVRDVARTRTISVMRMLNSKRNYFVINFLREAKLVTDGKSIFNGADLHNMNLQELDFSLLFLQGANFLEAELQDAFLTEANLAKAWFSGANLEGANLFGANLEGADLQAANLENVVLHRADLSRADLRNAKVTKEQLREAFSLKGAIMPDGTIHD